PAKSCRRRRSSPAIRARPIPISTTRCLATSAAAVRMFAFAKQSKRPHQADLGRHAVNLKHHTSFAAPFGEHPSSADDFSRRGFLKAGVAAGGGLLLSLNLPFGSGEAKAADAFVPNAFIRIDRDGQILLTMPYVEMGQGTYTSIPMLIAEELEVDLKQVRLEHAPPNEKLYANPLLGVQATGNSNAI